VNLKHFLTATSAISFAFFVSPMTVKGDLPQTSSVRVENTSLKTGMDAKETRQVEVNGVTIENFAGTVNITSKGSGKAVRFSLKGSDDLLGQILVTCDHEPQKGSLYIAFEKDAPVLNDMGKLVLALEMPSTMPLDLTLVGGKGDIGPRETNGTKVNLNGFGDIRLQSVKNLESKVDGSGEITVMKIDGDATLAIRGDGKYKIQEGVIPDLKASIGGTGIVNIRADVGNADLKSEGAGEMTLKTVTGTLKQSMSGAGKIDIEKVEGSLSNKISGSAEFTMDCGKKKKMAAGG